MVEPFAAVSQHLDGQTEAIIDLMRTLTAIPALGPKNGGEGEWRKYEAIRGWLEGHGLGAIEACHAPAPECVGGVRPNAIARIPGRRTDSTVWIMAHLDVVPPGERSQWEHDPWSLVVRDGRLYGRGTEDNHQGLVAALFTAAAFHALGVEPERPLGVILVADEETGSTFGLDYVLAEHGAYFRPQDLIVVPDAGAPDSTLIEVAEKTLLWLKFTTRGKQVHASMPQDGNNALRAASDLVLRLETLGERFAVSDPLFVPPVSTFEPTRKEENVPNVNTLPGEDVFYMDCRILPGVDVGAVRAAVDEICRAVEAARGVTVAVEEVMCLGEAPPTPPDAPVVGALQEAIRAVYRVEGTPRGIGGGTVAASFRRRGLPAAVWCTMDQMAHQPNEYCHLAHLIGDAKVFAHLCL